MKTRILILASLAALGLAASSHAQSLTPAVQAKIDARIKDIATWAADPAVVDAVRAHNAALPAEHAAITQDKWKSLPILDPLVRGFNKNACGVFLKAKKDDFVTEAFVSDANGLKVAFLSKTSGWSHKGKDKHDVPMSGKTWQGPVEVDESTGQQQLQVAVPVLDGGKPIGSLIVGLSVTKLSQ